MKASKIKGSVLLIILLLLVFTVIVGCDNNSLVGPSDNSDSTPTAQAPHKEKPISVVDPIVGPEVEP